MIPITLPTKHLILRRAIKNDAQHLFNNYFSDSNCSRFLTRKPYFHIEQAENFLKEWCDIPWEIEKRKFAWVIAEADSNEGVGIFLVEREDNNTAQIHYGISHAFSNQGYVTEAGHAVIRWLSKQEKLEKIWALCDLDNEKSGRVLIKLGFKNQEILKNKLILPAFDLSPRDCYLYTYLINDKENQYAEKIK